MRTNRFFLPALMACLGLLRAGQATGQTFTVLHSFTSTDPVTGINTDGANPNAGLILSGNTLYGTAVQGGGSHTGTVFAVNTDGTGFTNLHNFTGGSDGARPYAGLTLSGNTLYGTAHEGGASRSGTVFAVNTDGTGFTTLHSFTARSPGSPRTNSDGAFPTAGLILSGGSLYGTAYEGGDSGYGTIFAVNTNGTGFTNLHSFTRGSDGAFPNAGLLLSGSTLYGTAAQGGSSGNGTVFKVNTDGTDFTTLHSFTETPFPDYSNSDGANPLGGLILSERTLYGTANGGGSSVRGTVFKVDTNGTGFTTLHSFAGSDGDAPYAGLVLSDNTLYGTAYYGGSAYGTVFALNTNGTEFTTLHVFTALNYNTNSDGANPAAGLVFSGNTLYGTAYYGGASGRGTVFSLSLDSLTAPQLTIIPSGANVILTWPANAAGFTLQSAPAVMGTFTNVPGATSPYTNPITGSQEFFRLISN